MITVEGGRVREGYGTTPPKDKKLGACPERSRSLMGEERRLQRTRYALVCEDQAPESGEAFMIIVGCDFHPCWQQVAIFDATSGEMVERKLVNGNGEAEQFYRSLLVPSLVGLESCGNSQWFLELVEQLGHEVWIGDAAAIRASYVRKQKTDRRDAGHILKLLLEGRFPRLWTPAAEVRDLRQLRIHRHRLVQIRTRMKNGLQHLAMNRGMQKKGKLWSQAGQRAFLALPLPGWAGCRRQDLLALLAKLDQQIRPLDAAVEKAAFYPRASPAADDAARSGRNHGAGLRPDHRRCQAISAWQAGG
jgi:hypothetical protein